MSQRPPVRVAISGGGLAGATLAHALLKHAHLDVHIFESAGAFREDGAAVGLALNALSALDLIGASAAACPVRAGAVDQKGVRFMLAQGPDAGEDGVMIDEVVDDSAAGGRRVVSTVHRGALLGELLAVVPPGRMHASKRLEGVDRGGGGAGGPPVTLRFADGTAHECDVLIGADGIHSTVRGIVLGGEDPAARPRNTGWWAIMRLMPYAEARAALGEGLVDAGDPRQYGWTGSGAYLMHDVLGGGQLVQVVACGMDESARGSGRWETTLGADEIRGMFRGWPAFLRGAVDKVRLFCDRGSGGSARWAPSPSLEANLHIHAAPLRRAGAAGTLPVGAPSRPHVRLGPHRRHGRRRARHHALAGLRRGHGHRGQPRPVRPPRPRRDALPGRAGPRGVRPGPLAAHAAGRRVEQGDGDDADGAGRRGGTGPG